MLGRLNIAHAKFIRCSSNLFVRLWITYQVLHKSVQLLFLDGQLVAGLRLFVGSGQIFIDTLVFD